MQKYNNANYFSDIGCHMAVMYFIKWDIGKEIVHK